MNLIHSGGDPRVMDDLPFGTVYHHVDEVNCSDDGYPLPSYMSLGVPSLASDYSNDTVACLQITPYKGAKERVLTALWTSLEDAEDICIITKEK